MAGRRDLADGQAPAGEHPGGALRHLARGRHVDLVERDYPWPVRQVSAGSGLVGGEFRLDHVQVGDRLAARLPGRARGTVQHMNQHRAALYVAQEVQAQAPAPARPRDEARHVSYHELGLAGLDHAQVRGERGEGVVADLGPGGRHGSDQRRLARVGVADEAGVGHGLQLEHE
jgi:hypothetical protein